MLKINDIKLYRSDSKWKLQKEQLDKVQRRCCYTSESQNFRTTRQIEKGKPQIKRGYIVNSA